MNKLPSLEIEISVPFHDIDIMDVAWHGHYAKYFEIARCALLDSFNYDYPQMRESGYAWPVIDLRVRYIASARYGQRLRVRAEVKEWEHRLWIDYLILDAETGAKLTRGHTVQVAVELASGEMQLASPAVLAQRLGLNPEDDSREKNV